MFDDLLRHSEDLMLGDSQEIAQVDSRVAMVVVVYVFPCVPVVLRIAHVSHAHAHAGYRRVHASRILGPCGRARKIFDGERSSRTFESAFEDAGSPLSCGDDFMYELPHLTLRLSCRIMTRANLL